MTGMAILKLQSEPFTTSNTLYIIKYHTDIRSIIRNFVSNFKTQSLKHFSISCARSNRVTNRESNGNRIRLLPVTTRKVEWIGVFRCLRFFYSALQIIKMKEKRLKRTEMMRNKIETIESKYKLKSFLCWFVRQKLFQSISDPVRTGTVC